MVKFLMLLTTPLALQDLLEAESMYVEDSEGEGTKKESDIYREP